MILDYQIKQKIQEQYQLTKDTAIHIDHSIRRAINNLEELAKSLGHLSLNKAILDTPLLLLKNISPFFNTYFVMDNKGNWISFPNNPFCIGKNVSESQGYSVYKAIETKKTTNLEVLITPNNKPITGACTPILSSEGELKGLLSGAVCLTENNPFKEILSEILSIHEGKAFIVNSRGQIMMHLNQAPSADFQVLNDVTNLPPVQQVLTGETGYIEYELYGQTWIASYSIISNNNWGIILQRKKNTVVREAEALVLYFSLGTLGSFLMLGLLLFLFTYYHLKPLRDLEGVKNKSQSIINSPIILQSHPEALAEKTNVSLQPPTCVYNKHSLYKGLIPSFEKIARFGFIVWELDSNQLLLSEGCYELLGMIDPRSNFSAIDFFNSIHPLDQHNTIKTIRQHVIEKERFSVEYQIKRADHLFAYLWSFGKGLYNEKGLPHSIVWTIQDITEKKRTEEQLREDIKKYNDQIKEIHHRIKNNLQIMSSFIDMISMRAMEDESIDLLRKAQSKIFTMALIHVLLYEKENFFSINLGQYVERLIDYLTSIYPEKSKFITTIIEHKQDITLSIDQAIPCALCLNELITNVFIHAFNEDQAGEIKLVLQKIKENRVHITISDNGRGLPEDLEILIANALGIKLVRNISTGQLRGSFKIFENNGTTAILEFTLSHKAA